MYSFTIDIPAPVEHYDGLHQALLAATGGQVDGLLVHLGRPTAQGFQVTEVWQSQDAFERFSAEVVGPVMSRLAGGAEVPPLMPTSFPLRGLILSGEEISV
ncbi:MAG: hypothetical protein ABWY56_12755 [Propionibacteriaceae bacterium]